MIASIEIPGWTKPHPWVTPLHMAARLGLPGIAMLLLARGAMANGAGAAAFARRTPLQVRAERARGGGVRVVCVCSHAAVCRAPAVVGVYCAGVMTQCSSCQLHALCSHLHNTSNQSMHDCT